MRRIHILYTSDTHAFVMPTSYNMEESVSQDLGLARASTFFNQLRKEAAASGEQVITIDGGDFLQGSALGWYLARIAGSPQALTDTFNLLNYDLVLIGNHEFNYGVDYLQRMLSSLQADIVCANILKEDGETAFGEPFVILERDGIKLGFLGLSTAFTPFWERQEHIEGLRFEDAVTTAKKYAPELRKQCDVFIIVYHGSLERDPETGISLNYPPLENQGYALVEQVDGLDILLLAHQHRHLEGKLMGVPYAQLPDKATEVLELILDCDVGATAKGGKVLKNYELKFHQMGNYMPDPKVTGRFIDISQDLATTIDEVVGYSERDLRIQDNFAARLRGHPYLDWLNQLQLSISGAEISATALFDHGVTGFYQEIRIGDILQAYPYPNTIAVLEITGKELRQALERCADFFILNDEGEPQVNPAWLEPKYQLYNYDLYYGIRYSFDLQKPPGERVVRLDHADGRPIMAMESLEIALNNYRAVGGGNYPMFEHSKIVREVPLELSDHMIEKIKADHGLCPVPPQDFRVIY